MTMTSAIHRPLTRTRFGSSASAVDNHSAAPTGVLAGFMEWVIFALAGVRLARHGVTLEVRGLESLTSARFFVGGGVAGSTASWQGRVQRPDTHIDLRPIGATDPAAIIRRPWECGFESRLGAYLRLVRITAIPAA